MLLISVRSFDLTDVSVTLQSIDLNATEISVRSYDPTDVSVALQSIDPRDAQQWWHVCGTRQLQRLHHEVERTLAAGNQYAPRL